MISSDGDLSYTYQLDAKQQADMALRSLPAPALLVLGSLVIGIGLLIFAGVTGAPLYIWLIAAALVLAPVVGVIAYAGALRSHFKNWHGQYLTQNLTDRGLEVNYGEADDVIEWSSMMKWRENAISFLMILPAAKVLMVPKSAVPAEEQNELRTLLTTHLGPARGWWQR
ncbi:YcxB family protein [Granulicoccus phenolivorans]|uniref:YcxB family protein n=1 Tax=Granulicoccus phenolivorans TaxID=266854 RepID=UPI0003FDE6CD|nr:YcxB family protein [Granulicoccus phenolivorans]